MCPDWEWSQWHFSVCDDTHTSQGKKRFLLFFLQRVFKDLIYFFPEKGREKERERNLIVWLPLMHSQLGTWSATQAGALTGNGTSGV